MPQEQVRTKRVMGLLLLSITLLLLVPSLQGPAEAQDNGKYPEGARIWGYIYDLQENTYLSNMTVTVERDLYLGNTTKTDASGYYSMDLPSGEFVLRIFDEENFIIYRFDFNISDQEGKRFDFKLDADNRDQSRIFGSIKHKFTLGPMSGVKVKAYRHNATYPQQWPRVAETDSEGDFDIKLPAGNYKLTVTSEGVDIYKKDITLNFSQDKELDLLLEQPSSAFTIGNALKLLEREWLNIVIMVITVVIGLLLLAYIDRVFNLAVDSIRKKPRRFVDISILLFGERVVKWNIIILMMIVIAFLVAQILDIMTTLWLPIRDSIASIYMIILLVIFMRISLMIWKQFVVYMRGGHTVEKPKKILSSRMITLIEIIGKYLIAFFFALGIVLTALAALGMSDYIIGGLIDGLMSNAGFIIFIITLVIIAYVAVKFMSSFFEDMKGKSTRFRPEMIEIAGKGLKLLIYAIIGMIMAFTLLSAAGLGEIGQTIIIVFSMIVGLVVSMAATGSIGNMLSGLVIMSFKPFEEGDWVTIATKYQGEIVETNLMFTKLRDLEDEVIELPNNLILSQGIVNWTSAAKRGGFAIEIDATIGYDVPAKQVMTLMVKSCEDIKGLLKGKKPHVVLTEFHNHAIGYKLRAYIDTPHHKYRIKTDIMVNMQKTFTEAGVEILSPIYEIGRLERTPTSDEVKERMKKMQTFE